MPKFKQVSIKFSFRDVSKCDVCGKDDKAVVEVGDEAKFSICDNCAQEIVGIHSNMKLMKSVM